MRPSEEVLSDKLESQWNESIGFLRSSSRSKYSIYFIAAEIGERWPYSNRFEKFDNYIHLTYLELTAIWGIGKVKLSALIKSAFYLATDYRELDPNQIDDFNSALQNVWAKLQLSQTDWEIIDQRLKCTWDQKKTLEEIAQKLNLTRERVWQMETEIIEKFRAPNSLALHKKLLDIHDEATWRTISKGEVAISNSVKNIELFGNLSGDERLVITIVDGEVESWLNRTCRTTPWGWHRAPYCDDEINNSRARIREVALKQEWPIHFDQIYSLTHLPELLIRLTLVFDHLLGLKNNTLALKDPAEQRWMSQYLDLKEFYKKMGHANVPHQWEENSGLGAWAQRQRKLKRENRLEAGQINLLQKIGFEWSLRVRRSCDDRHEELNSRWEAVRKKCRDLGWHLENSPLLGNLAAKNGKKWYANRSSDKVRDFINHDWDQLNSFIYGFGDKKGCRLIEILEAVDFQ